MLMGAFGEQVLALTEALEELPVIRKLDLRGNDAMGVQVSAARHSHNGARWYCSLNDMSGSCN